MFNKSIKVNNLGHLEFAGMDTTLLAREFGTPVYCMDEDYIRSVCRNFLKVLRSSYPNSLVCFASKAFCTKAIYKIIESEGLGADVAGKGELFTALKAGFDMSKVYFHGNNKLQSEIDYAIENDVHALVVDCESEIDLILDACRRLNKRTGALLRLNPGIDAHTHKLIQTARTDSKFGLSVFDGSALNAIKKICASKEIDFLGLHCHIGSQIFRKKPFMTAVLKLSDFIQSLKIEHGIETRELNLGGGYGIHYLSTDTPLEPHLYVRNIVDTLLKCIKEKGILAPKLILEPGRSIVGEGGITLYTAGAVKDIKDIKKYISIDGGLFENPRYSMYGAKYTVINASRADSTELETVTLAGKCCESDLIAENIQLAKTERGDIIAVLSTGAYNYSMASNYNRNPVPPVVLIKEQKAEYIVRPQTFEDIIMRDIIPNRLT